MRAVDFIIADIRDNAYARREEDMAEDPDPNGWATKTESEIHALVLDDMANFTTDAYSQLGAEVPVGTTPLANGGWIPPSKNDDVSCNCAGRCTDSNGCPQNTAWNRASREQKLRIAKRIEDAMPKPCCDHHNEPHFCTHEEEVNGVYEQCGCEGD
jgi:hypothetical protein